MATKQLDAKVRQTFGRSGLTNRPAELDKRTRLARSFRDITSQLIADAGGADHCSEVKLQLLRRFSAACCMAEVIEQKMAAGEPVRIDEHSLLVSSAVRIASRIGLNRLPRNITPDLATYLESRSASQDENDDQREEADE